MMTDIEKILAGLDPKVRNKFKLARDISIEKLPTASFGINLMLNGGIDLGKQSTMWGSEQAGKSAFWLQTIALNQSLGKTCAYFDAERTFDRSWAERLGVDTDALIVPRVNSISEFTDMSMDLMRLGTDLIVLDSLSALLPRMYFEDDGTVKSFDDVKQLGRFAAEMGQASRMLLGENTNTALVYLSQVRMDLGGPGTMTPQKSVEGKEVGHLDSLRLRISTGKSDKYVIKGKVQYGDAVFEEDLGKVVSWSTDKNKMNGKTWSSTYNLMLKSEPGIDVNSELIEWGKRFGLVQGTTWLEIYGEKFQGAKNAVKYLRDNPEIQEKLKTDIYTSAAA